MFTSTTILYFSSITSGNFVTYYVHAAQKSSGSTLGPVKMENQTFP